MWDTNGGIYLGFRADAVEGQPPALTVAPDRYVDDRGIMLIGPNGSGKSRRLLLANLALLTGWTVIVIDPKGELRLMTQEHRENHGAETVGLNPYHVHGLGSDGYNPVAALDPSSDDFPDDALALAEAMIRIEGNEPHWSASAQDLVTALIIYSRLSQQDGGSLPHVRSLLGLKADGFKKEIDMMLSLSASKNVPELGIKAARYADIDSDSRELNAIFSTALTQMRWLDSRPIKRDLSKSSAVNFAQLREKPTTVYLTLPAKRLGTHSTWMRLMITAILQPLLLDTKKAKVPVLLMLDEYPALAIGGFPIIEKNMAMFRGYGLKLLTVFQDLNQARKLYGDGWESFAANAGVLLSFAPQDVETAEYLSKRTGLTTLELQTSSRSLSVTSGKPPSIGDSTNTNIQPVPLMLAQDLRNMDAGFSVYFSHTRKGTRRTYLPFHLKGLEHIYALDPSI